MAKHWQNSWQYQRLLEVLDDYWLSEPDELIVSIHVDFVKADGQTQTKDFYWVNPNYEAIDPPDPLMPLDELAAMTAEDFERERLYSLDHKRFKKKEMEYCFHDKEKLTLTDEQQAVLKKWISDNLKKRRWQNTKISSYGLKHIAEKLVGFYVSNADMKKAMVESGFECYRTNEINWNFNVTQQSINKVFEMARRTNHGITCV